MKELDACKVLRGEFDTISQVREAVVATRQDLHVTHKNGEKWTARTPNGDRVSSELDATFQTNARRLFIVLLDRQEDELKTAEEAVLAANKGVDDLAKQLDDKIKEIEALKLDNETLKETITDRNAIIAELTEKITKINDALESFRQAKEKPVYIESSDFDKELQREDNAKAFGEEPANDTEFTGGV